jgi:hypothetical protein
MQAAELFLDAEQEKADGKARDEQVLPLLPEAHDPQGI